MKRIAFIVLAVVLSIILSSCFFDKSWEEKYDSLYEQYCDIDDKLLSASARVDELESALSKINDYFATAYCYYENLLDDITEEEAYEALENINRILIDLGY